MSTAGMILECVVRDLLSSLCCVSASCTLRWSELNGGNITRRVTEIDATLLSVDGRRSVVEERHRQEEQHRQMEPLLLFEVAVTTVPEKALRKKRRQVKRSMELVRHLVPDVRGCIVLVTIPQVQTPYAHYLIRNGALIGRRRFRGIIQGEQAPVFLIPFEDLWGFGIRQGYPLSHKLRRGMLRYAELKGEGLG